MSATKATGTSLINQDAEGADGSPRRTLWRGLFLAITKAALNALMDSAWPLLSNTAGRLAGVNAWGG